MFNPFLGPDLVFQYESGLQKPIASNFKSTLCRGIELVISVLVAVQLNGPGCERLPAECIVAVAVSVRPDCDVVQFQAHHVG